MLRQLPGRGKHLCMADATLCLQDTEKCVRLAVDFKAEESAPPGITYADAITKRSRAASWLSGCGGARGIKFSTLAASEHNPSEKRKAMKRLSCCVLLLALSGYVHAQSPLTLYDNFNARLINPDRWVGAEFPGPVGEEAVREILGGSLHLAYRGYGTTQGNFSNFMLQFRNPANIRAIQATVKVRKYAVKDCPENPSPTSVDARLLGFFFGDVFTTLLIRGYSTDPIGVLRVQGFVEQCNAAGCQNLGFQELGTATVGQDVTLRIQWDSDNHRFIFQRDNLPQVFSPYAVADDAPGGPKWLDISMTMADCPSGPRPFAFMDALFDNVFVN